MIETDALLSGLKYTGITVSGFASVWSLISKTSYDDENGRKRLTGAGKISIGVAILSALIGMMAFGFESLQREQAKLNAQRDKALADAQRDRDLAASDRRYEIDQRRRRDSEESARFLTLKAMAQQAAGDARLARRLAENNARVLSGFSATLHGIERVSLPLHRLVVELTSVVPLKGVLGDSYIKRLLGAVGSIKQASSDEESLKFDRVFSDGVTVESFSIAEGSRLFPHPTDEADWYELLTGRMEFDFFADASHVMRHLRREGPRDTSVVNILDKKTTVEEASKRAPAVNPFDPDVTFDLKPEKVWLSFSTSREYLTMRYRFVLDWSNAQGSGRLTSQIDLDHASLLIFHADFARVPRSDGRSKGDIPEGERFCQIDIDTGLKELKRRKFDVYQPYANANLIINELASYRPPSLYADMCERLGSRR